MKTYWPAVRVGGVLLVAGALAPWFAGAQALKNAALPVTPAISVSQVDVTRNGHCTIVHVQGKGGRLSYHVTRMSDPARVVVDFDDAGLSVSRNAIPSSFEPVRGVRLGQSQPNAVRLVIDLVHVAPFTVENNGTTLDVTFADSAALPSEVSTASAAVADSRPEKASAVLPVAPRASGVTPDFPLPATLTTTTSALATPGPLPQLAPAQNPAPAAGAPQQSAGQAAVPVADQKYSGEPISVNLKDVDLKDFFRLIHEISGLNVVLDPAVRGTVTLVLDEVPWDQALDIVLRNNNLSKELSGNVLRIATPDTIKKEATDRRDILKAQSDAIETVTSTRVLSYAKATELVTPLKRFLSPRGDIMAIDRSNTLIIRDVPAAMPPLDNLIRQLDRKSQQVEIQARVVQASRSFARDIGAQWGAAGVQTSGSSANFMGGVPTATFGSPVIHSPAPPVVVGTPSGTTGSLPLNVDLPSLAGQTSGFMFSHVSPNFALDFMITAAESHGAAKLLSSPQLITQNNAQAVVKQGAQIPIQTTVNNTVSVQYIDAVLKLQVTPQITADGTVYMDILVENTQPNSAISVNGVPELTTQSAQTKVLITDGGTVVIGGVMVSEQQTNTSEVPLFGSIPVIGHLFKERAVTVSSQELLFFVTPRILPG